MDEIDDEYLEDARSALGYGVGYKNYRTKSIRRAFLLAAVISLLLAAAGCAAAWFRLSASEELTNVVFCINLKDVYGNNHSNHTEFYSFNEVIAPGDTKSRTVISEFPCPKESAEIRYISVTVPYKDYSRVAYEAFPNEGLYLVNK